MSFDFRVTLSGAPAEFDANFLGTIKSNVEGALRQIGRYIQGQGTIDVGVSFTHAGTSGYLADSDTEMFVPIGNLGTSGSLLRPGTIQELLTGSDPNGATQDLHIILNQDILLAFWFDPTPDDRSDAGPSDLFDFEGVMMHELLHGLGFTGNNRQLDGSFLDGNRGLLDQQTRLDPVLGWVYDSEAMRAATNGSPVAVDTTHGLGSRWYHLTTQGELMFYAGTRGARPVLSDADLAVLHDNGAQSATPDATSNIWFGTTGADRVDGLAGDDHLYGLSGDDTITGGAGNDLIDGGDGYDIAVFSGVRAAYTITGSGAEHTVTGEGTDTLRRIEALQFSDRTLYMLGGSDATVARLYGAAFGRAPDTGGMAVQLNALHAGLTPLQLAANFIGSAEFVARYGAATTDAQYVTALYNNVLGRIPDQGGFNVQVNALAQGLSRAQLLVNFGESAENQARAAADWLLT